MGPNSPSRWGQIKPSNSHQVRASSLDAYRKALGYLTSELGEMAVADVRPETITGWQSRLLDKFAPYTVLNFRKAARQVFAEAQRVGVLASNPFDLVKAPRARRVTDGRALNPDDARKLISAAGRARLGAVITLLFCQGWRVSEVLGLAWEDLDLKAGTARIQRALAHSGVSGLVLGPTKTSGAEGVHHLAPIAIANLGARRIEQNEERLTSIEPWPTHICQGAPVSLVFTNTTGGFVTRQSINKLIERTARSAGIDPTGLATHAGRRTVITALYADGGLDLTDIARHVGHTSPTTTAGYVRSFGRRSEQTAQRAAELLDPSLAGSLFNPIVTRNVA
jgi:integrase